MKSNPSVEIGAAVDIAIIMGSVSDLAIMKPAIEILESFSVSHCVEIISAHRTPKRLFEFATQAAEKNIKIIIAGAGGAAHLPGMCASLTTLPVIGVPINATALDGMDSLLSIVQMPKGIPVATVAINNSTNAALLALKILGLHDKNIQIKMASYQRELEIKVAMDNSQLQS